MFASLTWHQVLLNISTLFVAIASSTISFTEALISGEAEVENEEPSLADDRRVRGAVVGLGDWVRWDAMAVRRRRGGMDSSGDIQPVEKAIPNFTVDHVIPSFPRFCMNLNVYETSQPPSDQSIIERLSATRSLRSAEETET